MKPSERIKYFRNRLIKLCNIVGIQMTDKLNNRYIFVLIIATTYLAMFLNGCYQNFDDPYKFLHALTPAALISVNTARIFSFLVRDWNHFQVIMDKKTLEFYEKHESDQKYSKILSKRVNEVEFVVKLNTCCFVIFYHLPIVYSVLTYLVTGEKILFILNYLPWTDSSDDFGFFLNLSILTLAVPIAYLTAVSSDNILLFFVYQLVPFCDILCSHLDELGEELLKLYQESWKITESEEKSNRWVILREVVMQRRAGKKYEEKLMKLEQKFIEIVKEHQEYNQIIEDIVFYSEITCFTVVFTNSLSIGMSVVSFFKISMTIGAIGALMFTSQVALPCLIGTLISSQNTRINDKLAGFPWFIMSKSKQKVFLQLIHNVQETTEYIMPIFGYTIDLEAFAEVLNVSYSYFTFFFNMSEE